ncbi:MAG TPA: ABC transporter permease [Dehalococcoidia bacterium]|nr:ABC transporter permease [Dehalococcoidia bacterium]
MSGYILKRLLQAVPVVIITTIVVFLLLRLIPGDPAQVIAGSDATPQQVAAIRHDLGLNRSLPEQYLLWAERLLRGDLGHSYVSRRSVGSLIKLAFPATLQLTLCAFLIALLVGIPFGVAAGLRPNSPWDFALSAFTAVMQGIPNFLFAIIYLLVFALYLGWLPPGGRSDPFAHPLDGVRTLALPVLTLALPAASVYARFVKTALTETLAQDYVRTARAKGLGGSHVVLRHALRNALLPLVTIAGIQFGRLLGGTVIVEQIFAWPGMGRLALDAIGRRDYLLFQGIVLLLVLGAVLVNLLTDLSYGVLDPRIRTAR